MTKEITIYLIDAFTKVAGKGNRAGVVLNADGLTEKEMQEIATFANVSETAFVMQGSPSDGYDLHIRYFTPTTEIPLCGHATIATHYLRALKENIHDATVTAKTGAGILPVDISTQDRQTYITMTQGTPKMGDILSAKDQEILLNALGLSADDLIHGLPLQLADTGHAKVMIPIKSQEKLNQISPDLEALKTLSHKINCNGYYIFTIEEEGQPYKTHGRMFAPAIGIDEDPVTGMANGIAGLYLAHHGVFGAAQNPIYQAIQGEAINSAGDMKVMVEMDGKNVTKVQIAGTAIQAKKLTYRL